MKLPQKFKNALAGIAAMTVVTANPTPAEAQAYPIDCAILLCLSGGWPASAECTAARAEFIRRITPWPIEPPLQIWRCPMGASYQNIPSSNDTARFYDVLFSHRSREGNSDFNLPKSTPDAQSAVFLPNGGLGQETLPDLPNGPALYLAQNRADVDISDPAFNFVRSIRLYDVTRATQRESGDGECNRSFQMRVGVYGRQGQFRWISSNNHTALPKAHRGLNRYGDHCPTVNHRSIFVEWRDYDGNYDFEQIRY